MKITATIQARLGSSRLPGKVMMDICGRPMLQWQIERIKRSRLVDDVIVATTHLSQDDAIEDFCKKNNVYCYRGSENDVLNRIASLIREYKVELHVECYGDSPLIDPQIIDEFIGYYFKHRPLFDCVSSAIKTSYPPGFEVVVYPGVVLDELDRTLPHDDPLREHVGYNLTRFPDKYRIAALEAPSYYCKPNTYLEVDTKDDLRLMTMIIQHFSKKQYQHFSLAQTLDFLENNPDLLNLNSFVERRWKLLRDKQDV